MFRLAIAWMIALASPAGLAQKMEPGEWEFTNTMSSPKLPKPQTMTMKRCITKEDVSDPAHFQGKPEADCKVTPKGKKGEAYAWEMSCPKSGMKGTGTTRYGKNTVEGETKITASSKGQPFDMTTKMKGRRLGPCK
jgi:nitrite reductase/ring-hydroxylating ferredoxin subunit